MNNQTKTLMRWYDAKRRILPWREDPTPYHIWLSEIILQQTRVEAGKEYYLRFLERFPDIEALAEAPEDVYMKLWEGLGYYSRVRNLHKAAVIIIEQYGGCIPRKASELRKLPGIGPYTAAAIASIAFGEKVVSVDGNLIRVFARMTEYGEDARSQEAKREAEKYFSVLQPAERPGDFNQALMDLGAMVCLPNGIPLCSQCPWAELCLSHRNERELQYPIIPGKKVRRIEKRTVLLLYVGGKLVIRRRPEKGLLAGLYEFPNETGHLKESEIVDSLGKIRIFKKPILKEIQFLGDTRHIFSHIEWHMKGYGIVVDPSSGLLSPWMAASPEELETRYPIPSAFRFYQKQIHC